MPVINCKGCGKELKVRGTKRLYCSHICYSTSRIGYKASFDNWGSKNPNWRGGKRVSSMGYILIYAPYHPTTSPKNQYVMEHRLVMEKAIKRFLTEDEVVHHINEIPDDNRIENLQLMTNSEHSTMHGKARVKEFRKCKLDGCLNKHKGLGYCNTHYQRMIRGLLPELK